MMLPTSTGNERRPFFASWIGILFPFSHCFICKSLPSCFCLASWEPWQSPILNAQILTLFSLSFLDRTNIGNAKLFGLQKDLHMPTEGTGALQYNTALAVFFPFYVAAEIPSNMMMRSEEHTSEL